MQPVKRDALPADMPTCGVYLFSDRGRHLYVGRSNGRKYHKRRDESLQMGGVNF
jgi:hypothetical protein